MRQYAPRTGTFSRPKPCHNIKLTHYPVLTWEMLRYQRMKVGVLAAHQRPALESLLRRIKVRPAAKTGISEVVVQSEARRLAAPWFDDPASRPATMKMIETAGYPPNAIEVEAFQLAFPASAPIARLIVSALSVSTGIWRIWRAPRKLMPGRSFEQSREVKPACRALMVAFNY